MDHTGVTASHRPQPQPQPHRQSTVEVVAYRATWPADFASERTVLAAATGGEAVTIEHIGSTAVPGMSSKPTIDILMVFERADDVADHLRALADVGYELRPGAFPDRAGHLFMRKVVEGRRLVHLHVLDADSVEIDDYRRFRDALRADPDLAARYQALKVDLAERFGDDRARYVAEKERWVDAVVGSLRAEGTGADALYDRIGVGYAGQRVSEPTWVSQIGAALGASRSVLNVGAGSGNYEPVDRRVVALEPSSTMLAQRDGRHPAVQGVAEHLPFPDGCFDAALGTFTVHHWTDPARGLAELARVADRQVLVVFEPLVAHGFWLLDYFPEVLTSDVELNAPTPDDVGRHLDVVDVQTMWIPAECRDGVAAAYWRRPEAYLDPVVQRSMSLLALLPESVVARGTAELAADLADGTWLERHGHLLEQDRADYGYRLVIAGS